MLLQALDQHFHSFKMLESNWIKEITIEVGLKACGFQVRPGDLAKYILLFASTTSTTFISVY